MEEKQKKQYDVSRRSFLLKGSAVTLGLFMGHSAGWAEALTVPKKPNSKFFGVQIGVTTYSYRSMPDFYDVHKILQYIVNSGISGTELTGESVEHYAGKPEDKGKVADWRAHVGMGKFREIRRMFKKAGVHIYAFKPRQALEADNTDAEIEYALRAGKALGAKSVSVELPKDPKQTERLGKLAAKHKMYIGYHAHTQASDTAWDVALSQSPYNTMNLDCGHYIAAAGNNTAASLLALIRAKHERITSLHLKDRTTKAHGAGNFPWGEGDTPIKGILDLLKEEKYNIPATIELEYKIPQGSNAVKETKRCMEFAKHALGA